MEWFYQLVVDRNHFDMRSRVIPYTKMTSSNEKFNMYQEVCIKQSIILIPNKTAISRTYRRERNFAMSEMKKSAKGAKSFMYIVKKVLCYIQVQRFSFFFSSRCCEG
jgi:hypothetical protein